MTRIIVQASCHFCKNIFFPDRYKRSRKKLREGYNWYCSKECQYKGIHNRTVSECFWDKVEKLDEDCCWNWKAALYRNGYGNFRGNCAHRKAWELTYGIIKNGIDVLHKCDNPPCCNPRHLFLGTQLENMHDMISKGRAAWQK